MKSISVRQCLHEWEESERFYAPPTPVRGWGLTQQEAERFAFGVTTIVSTCSKCGRKHYAEVLGRSIPAPSELPHA